MSGMVLADDWVALDGLDTMTIVWLLLDFLTMY
jgi:hypothetical protein